MWYDAPDVSPEVAELQARGYRAMSPDEKLAIVDSLWRLAREVVRAGVRMRHPQLDEAGVEHEVRALFRRAAE